MTTVKEIIPLKRDFIFSEVFNNIENISILENFIATYLSLDKDKVRGNLKLLSRRLPNTKRNEARKEVDVLLDLNGEKIIIELNANSFKDGIKSRNLGYASEVFVQQYKKGDKELKNINKVLEINLNVNSTKYENNEKLDYLINEFFLIEKRDLNKIFTKKFEIDVIDMSKSIDVCYTYVDEREKVLAKWCKIILAETLDAIKINGEEIMENNELEKLITNVETLSSDDEMIRLESTHTKQEIAHMDDLKEKYEEGLEQGCYMSKVEIVKNMKNENYDLDAISRITGLSIDEVNKILE